MSVCVFLAADSPLPAVQPPKDYPLHIDFDRGTVDDGGTDDNYTLRPFLDAELYAGRKYGVELGWHQYTEGRAQQIIGYIRDRLRETDRVELWNVWLLGYWEYEDRPVLHRIIVPIDELTPEDIRQLHKAKNWNNKEKDRPSFYCIEVIR